MNLGHMHVGVVDLQETINWMGKILGKQPSSQNFSTAIFQFEKLSLHFDKADFDAEVTIAFGSKDCDSDFRNLVDRGAVALKEPETQASGARSGYLRGPGRLTIEIEQVP